jgi:cytochrome c5
VSKADDIFFREFGVILIALTLFTLIVFLTARAIGARSFEKAQNSSPAVLERIRPFGQVRVGKPDEVVAAAAATPASAPATSGATSGEQVYSSTCMACHATGVAGAPKMGDKATWEPRMAQGLDALVMSSLKGKGTMPPKGGNTSLSDTEVKSAVEYMLQKAGLMEASASATPAAPAAAAGKTGEAVYSKACVACHSTGAAGAPKVGDKTAWEPRLAQGLDALVMSSLKGKGTMPPKGGNTSLSDAEVKSAVEYMLQKAGLVEASASAAPAAPAQATAPAAEPAAAAGKTGEAVYSRACVACHSTGAAGAPKLGDIAAWEPRTAQGLDTLVNSVLKGKGAMPAKGGNNSLSEDDIRNAVEFMVAGAGTAPSGSVAEAPAGIASADAADDSRGTAQPGDQVYMIACVNCHGRGVDGAPKVADRAAWASLETKGVDALVRSVVEGKGTMPVKGGSASLREDEIRGAVEFMLDAARFSATVTAATQPDTVDAADSQAAPSAEQVAATKPAPAAAAPGQAGEAVYRKACIACHSTGAAGAPKVGDDAAWKARAEKGINTLVGNAVSGVGTMPAKGGNTALSDEEVRNAVLFMLEQSGNAG